MYDFIGDLHGSLDELLLLFHKLGYKERAGTFFHPKRKAFFLGDIIDRGEKIRETTNIVKKMTETSAALCIMGNHEFNALTFCTKDKKGNFLRPHSSENISKIRKTLDDYKYYPEEWAEVLSWIKTLPFFIEDKHFRAVHAAWNEASINFFKENYNGNLLSKQLLSDAVEENTEARKHMTILQKGFYIDLPKHLRKNLGTSRNNLRLKWWDKAKNKTYREVAIKALSEEFELKIPNREVKEIIGYNTDEPLVFFGHYRLKGNIMPQKNNVLCLDYGVSKYGKLVCYRWQGEKTLNMNNIVWVDKKRNS